MTGPGHYRKAEKLTQKAYEYLGQGDGQEGVAVAQIHSALALAAATALGTRGADGGAWADVAAAKLSAGGA